MDKTSQKKASIFLILFAILLVIISVVAVLFYNRIDTYITSDAYFINPVRKEVVSFESAQTLYMYVEDIKESKDTNGEVTYTVVLKTIGDENEQKSVNVVSTPKMGGMDYFRDSIAYWDLEAEKLYYVSDKPETILDGIRVADIVIVYYRTSRNLNDTFTEAIITTVLK